MLHILGIGTAVGQTALGKSDVEQWRLSSGRLSSGPEDRGSLDRGGVSGCTIPPTEIRRSALGREYLAQTGNRDIEAVKQPGNQSPTDLCLAAAIAAISDAGISAEQLGLVIGECATPWQTTPGEGQRVADRLGLKVPAYDIGGGGIVAQHLAAVSRWRVERVPEYVLLLGGSTPTTRIDFTADGDQRWQFGDAAAACVVSVKHRGKFAVVEAESRFHGEGGDTFLVDQFLPLSARVEELTQRIEELTADAAARAIFKHKLHGPRVALACGEASAGMAQRIAKIHSISRTSSTFEDNGYTLSSGCFLGFEKLRSTLKLGDQLLLAQAHPGFMSGYTLCEVM